MEFLEERTLLSAMPLTSGEYTELTAKYSAIALPETMDDLNVITLDLPEGDGLAELKSAIETAGTTERSDLIVVRTTADANTLTYTSSTDTLSISIDSSAYGSLTLLALSDTPLTLDAAQLSRVTTIQENNGDINFGNIAFTNGKTTKTAGGGIYCSGTITLTNTRVSENRAEYIGTSGGGGSWGGGIYNFGTLQLISSEVVSNAAHESYTGTSTNMGSRAYGGGIYNSGKTLTVTWDAVPGASSYLVEYRDVKTAKWTSKAVKKGTSLAINGKVGTTYEIRVAAVTANGNSKAAVENVTVYAPLTTPKLKAMKDFCKDDTFAVEVTNYAANLASAAESVTFGMNGIYETFTIENGSGNVRFASGEVVTFQNGTFTVTNAKANTQYKLEVMFANPLTGSAFAKVNVKTTKTTYLAPTDLRVTVSTSSSITLDWSDSPAKTDASKLAQKYTVQYSTNGGKTWKPVSVKTSDATLTRLKSGTYLIRVLAAKDSKFEASLPTEILEIRL